MAGALDSILNIVIPIGAFIVLGFIIYKGFNEPIHDLVDWIRSFFAEKPQEQQPTYGRRRDSFGMDSSIVYK